MKESLTHINSDGSARMVDVSEKDVTLRSARAKARITMKPETLELITGGKASKGDVLAAARIAGIQAAKLTPNIIPLCHTVQIDSVSIEIETDDDPPGLLLESSVTCNARTGAEMEALTSVTAAALTVYDMCKAVDRGMTIKEIWVSFKSGGKSGEFIRE